MDCQPEPRRAPWRTYGRLGRPFSLGALGNTEHPRACRGEPGAGEPVFDDEPLADRGPALDPTVIEQDYDRTAVGHRLAADSHRLDDGSRAVLPDVADL